MIQGKSALQARLRAIRGVFPPVAQKWADDTATYARAHVPVVTGKTQRSIKARKASSRRATVVGRYTVNFIDAGTKAHREAPKKRKAMRYGSEGGVRFTKRVDHPRTEAKPFKRAAAEYGIRKDPMAVELVKLWNSAA